MRFFYSIIETFYVVNNMTIFDLTIMKKEKILLNKFYRRRSRHHKDHHHKHKHRDKESKSRPQRPKSQSHVMTNSAGTELQYHDKQVSKRNHRIASRQMTVLTFQYSIYRTIARNSSITT